MKIELLFLLVVFSVVTGSLESSDEESEETEATVATVVTDVEKTESAVDIAIKCIEEHGLLKCFEKDYVYKYKPAWRTKEMLINKLSEVANNYINKVRVEDEDYKNYQIPDENYCKEQVSLHTCLPLDTEEEPVIRIGNIKGCLQTIKTVCGQRFFDKLETETKPYPVIKEPLCEPEESPEELVLAKKTVRFDLP